MDNMKALVKLNILFLYLFLPACNGGQENSQDQNTQKQPEEEIKPDTVINEGPLAGKLAVWNKDAKGWVIAGDEAKAPALTQYNAPACTAGVEFRVCPQKQGDFKKIFWANEASLKENQGDFKISVLLGKGFGVICGSIEVLKGNSETPFKRQYEPIFFHPKVAKAAQEFYKLIYEDNGELWNQV